MKNIHEAQSTTSRKQKCLYQDIIIIKLLKVKDERMFKAREKSTPHIQGNHRKNTSLSLRRTLVIRRLE
jgi:hypothetical protein